MAKKITLILVTIIYAVLMVSFWNTVSADKSYVEGQRAIKRSEAQIALEQTNKSIQKNPNEPRYYYGRAKIFLTVGEKSLALEDLKKSENLNPKNLVTLRNIVPFYYFLAIEDLSQTELENNLDREYLEVAQNYFEKLKSEYPNDVGVQVLVAKYENELNLQENYVQTRENIKNLRPDLLEWYLK